jgi:hypothetical protein
MNAYDVIVIGGGAAGMMAAARAAARGRKVLLLEKNPVPGKKLSISGGGRCNILNAEEDVRALLSHYGESGKFLASPFAQFGMRQSYDFFESRGLPLKVEARKRAFPASEKAVDVVKALAEYMRDGGVDVRTRTIVSRIVAANGRVTAVEAGEQEYRADSFVLATGGVSHPETGSTGDGFEWLRALGLAVREPTPTIVPLATSDAWSHPLAGVTLKDVKLTFFCDGAKRFSLKGDVLLTHFGLSGPLILNAAGKVADLLQEGEVTARIDAFPALDLGILEKKMLETFDQHKNKALKNAWRDIAPPGAAAATLPLAGVDPEKKVHSVTREERRMLAKVLKALPVAVTGLMGFDRAVLADGGLHLSEVDTRTMRVKAYENLFVVGDVLHVRRPSGGYSLQLAWTTGFVAGSHA